MRLSNPSSFLVFIIIILSQHVRSEKSSTVNVTAKEGNHIIRKMTLLPKEGKKSFFIKSNIPVTLLRYYDASTSTFSVIGYNKIRIYVTSDCAVDSRKPKIRVRGDRKSATLVAIRGRGDVFPYQLPFNDYDIDWTTIGYYCPPGNFSKARNTTKLSHDRQTQCPKDNSNNTIQNSTNSICNMGVQILYDGCERHMQVKAPHLRVTNVTRQCIQTSVAPDGYCRFNNKASLKISSKNNVLEATTSTTKYTKMKKYPEDECIRAADGRPYIDRDGVKIQSRAIVTNNPLWSSSSHLNNNNNNDGNDDTHSIIDEKNDSSNLSSSSSPWIDRGRGEHASIASFASVVIELLTHGAPPHLIRDALSAALDEVDHTLLSFDRATAAAMEGRRTAMVMDPGALPPSSLHFERDVRGMITRTFREGCVDETISALSVAAEKQQLEQQQQPGSSLVWGDEMTLRKIAVDESHHAGLAWKIVWWACLSAADDGGLCTSDDGRVMFEMMVREARQRQQQQKPQRQWGGYSEMVIEEWERIMTVLLPIVTGVAKEEGGGEGGGWDCEGYDENQEGASFVREIGDRIILNVLCDSSSVSYDMDDGVIIDGAPE